LLSGIGNYDDIGDDYLTRWPYNKVITSADCKMIVFAYSGRLKQRRN